MTFRLFHFICALTLSVLVARAQSLNITNGVHTFTALTNTTVTMSGPAELWLTAATTPLPGSTVHLNSNDAWLFLPNIRPSTVASTYLPQLRVSGFAASGSNVRVVSHGMGSVVIPHPPNFRPLEVFVSPNFGGSSAMLNQYTAYNDTSLAGFANNISSFKLKRGYMATFAQNANGTGLSKNFVAQDGDLQVSSMPAGVDNSISFVRVFPWRWSAKKGVAGGITQNLNVRWFYNWNLNENSSPDLEYVPIRQNRYWPDLNQNWQTRGATHLLGYNEPDRPDQANLSVADAIASWPDLLASGLRVGAPAVSDGGLNWLYSFIDQADAAALRVDFVPVHYYRCFGNANDPDGAAAQFYNFLKGIHDRVQRPLWVTEWNNGANWTTCADPTFAQQQATIKKIIDMLDNTPFVECYAIYNWVEDVRRVQWDDGSLTAAGASYRDHISQPAYAQEGLPGGGRAIARFQFENDVLDSSGAGNNGIAIGIPDFVEGRFGQSIALDGTNSCVLLPVNTANTAGFTFAAWILWQGGPNWQRIFDFGNDTSHYLFLTPASGSGTLRFAINNGGGEQMIQTTALPVGQWRHVAVTLAGNTARLYVNGSLAASSAAFTIAPSQIRPRKNFLGKSQFPADPLFKGRLDEALLAPYALTAAEISALQTNQPPQLLGNGDGTWTANADGNWSDPDRWSGGFVATGAGFTADFSAIDITASRRVTLDAPHTIGALRFGDSTGPQNWTVFSPDNPLALQNTASPSIAVLQNTATLAVTLAGSSGFTKSGPGTLVLAASNSISGAINLDRGIDGNNNDGITRVAHPDALRNAASLNIRNTSVSTAGGATLQLDASSGNITINKPLSITSRNNTNTPAIQNLSGINILSGPISLNVGGNMFNIRSDAGLLILSGINQYVGSLTGGRTYAFSGAGDHLVSGPIRAAANGAPIGLAKSGSGTLTLDGVHTYTNSTALSGGTLLVNGSTASSPFTVNNATLGGSGTINGPVFIQANATLSPGAPIGRLTINNNLTLQPGGITRIEIAKAPLTNDSLRVSGSFTFGGALIVTNLSGSLARGDTFTIFEATSVTGSYSSITLPPLGENLSWDTSRLAEGVISVVGPLRPAIAQFNLRIDGSFNLNATGEPGVAYTLQGASNLTSPILWTDLANATADSNGAFQLTDPQPPTSQHRYYRVAAP